MHSFPDPTFSYFGTIAAHDRDKHRAICASVASSGKKQYLSDLMHITWWSIL